MRECTRGAEGREIEISSLFTLSNMRYGKDQKQNVYVQNRSKVSGMYKDIDQRDVEISNRLQSCL